MTDSPGASPEGVVPRPSGPLTNDAPGPAPAASAAPAAEDVAPVAVPVADAETRGALDDGTFDRLIEPSSPNRLELENGLWHQVSPKYVWVQLISMGSVLLITVVVALVLALVLHQAWVWIPAGIFLVILVWMIAITPRQARAIGYQLRDDDLVFRRGILWQRLVAVPYGRMQLVDITHGPLDRGFGIAQLKLVTAAAATGVTIPGLPQATAESLRDHLVAVAESRRTGL